MSRTKIALLLLMLMALLVAACGGGATATPRPPTAEPTEEAAAATEEATEEMAATEEATEAMAEATEVAMADDAMATASAVAGMAEAASADAMATATAIAGMAEAASGDAMATASAVAGMAEAASGDAMATASAVAGMAGDAMATASAVAGMAEAASGDAMATASAIAGMAEAASSDAMATASAVAGMADDAMATASAVVEIAMAQATEAMAEATEAMMEATAVPEAAGDLTPVRLQLQWVAQSQFCGYYAAEAQGFYEDAGLDVTILEGAVDIVPQQVVAAGGAEFGIAWVPKVLESRAAGADLVNIAQIFQRSGTLEVSFVDKGIESVDDLRGMRVGTWGFGNEHELFAALRAADIDPDNTDDVTIVQQPFDMSLLLNDEVDAAEAMTYNEYAQVLEQENPETGELYQPEELNVINFNDVGTAMLQDHIFATEAFLAEEGNEDIAVSFIRASIQGWIYCRDNFDDAVEIVLANGPTLGKGHMTWQLNEINKLIWPSPAGIGVMDEALWEQTVNVAVEAKVIPEAPSEGAYRTDLVEAALKGLQADDVDVTGEDWEAETVEITPGGE